MLNYGLMFRKRSPKCIARSLSPSQGPGGTQAPWTGQAYTCRKKLFDACLMHSLSPTSVCTWGLGCVSVCAVKKDFHCLIKGGCCKIQAILLCTDGVKSQEISSMAPDSTSFHTGEALTFPATSCRPSLEARLLQASTSWCMWVRTQVLPGNHSWVMTPLVQAGPGRAQPGLPTHQNQHTPPPTPHECGLLFLPCWMIQEIWHITSLRCKQDSISCQNLCKIPIALESQERNSRDKGKKKTGKYRKLI